MNPILLSTAYFASVRYYSKLLSGNVLIEKHEHYQKQSYRNRCRIYTANGLLDLTVPVVRAENPKIPVTQVEIAYDTLWQKLHCKAIESAYRRSPFFEYYMDDLMRFFTGHYRYLYDFNTAIMHTVCRLIGLPLNIRESETYMGNGKDVVDLRDGIHPKTSKQIPDPGFIPPVYTQVFEDRFGFIPDLSILDMMFNVGPETVGLLAG